VSSIIASNWGKDRVREGSMQDASNRKELNGLRTADYSPNSRIFFSGPRSTPYSKNGLLLRGSCIRSLEYVLCGSSRGGTEWRKRCFEFRSRGLHP
jgi:hypothetical protein